MAGYLRFMPTGCPDSRAALRLRSAKRAGTISDWSAEFEDPIELPNGRKLLTLWDAATSPRQCVISAGVVARRSIDGLSPLLLHHHPDSQHHYDDCDELE